MAQDKDKAPEAYADSALTWATGPTDVPAAGNDPDSRLRELKGQLARAESTGDTSTADTARKEIAKVQRDASRPVAAQARSEAAQGDPAARTRAPQGRTSTPTTQTGGSSGSKAQTTGGASATPTGGSSAGGKDAAGGGDKPAGKGK